MKTPLSVQAIFGFCLMFTGCDPAPLSLEPPAKQKQPSSPPPSSQSESSSQNQSIVTAPVDYIAETIKAREISRGVIDLAAIRKAIELYETTEGQRPSSLEELIEKKYLTAIPKAPIGKKIMYDPTTGKVSIVAKE